MNIYSNTEKFILADQVQPEAVARSDAQFQLLKDILVSVGEVRWDQFPDTEPSPGRPLPLARRLTADGLVSEQAATHALAIAFACDTADFEKAPPSRDLIDKLGAGYCLRHGLIPWKRVGDATLIATARPEEFADRCPEFPLSFGRALMVVAPESYIRQQIAAEMENEMSVRALSRVPAGESCRTFRAQSAVVAIAFTCLLLLLTGAVFPLAVFSALCIGSVATLTLNTLLKVAASIASLRAHSLVPLYFSSTRNEAHKHDSPRISLIVPLFKEGGIAARLVRRLTLLDYPRELLDAHIVVERDDHSTRRALSELSLPHWVNVIDVPCGELKTKPRALNYALDFCRGSIIGIYDAEDAPERSQLRKVAGQFARSGGDVACIQGMLDFYNGRANWLSRCFTIEYASWFRFMLPGLERLGLAVPLGGTTLFFRRDLLEKTGAWDAHNVTEDADLGIRLARHGYKTEIIQTVTEEEANCRFWPWIRQRSRWLKGYALTWLVHMKSPRKLWRDLGPRKFIGFQILFLATVVQFLLAPFAWSFWMVPLGLEHPIERTFGGGFVLTLAGLFIFAELLNIFVSILAVNMTRNRSLWIWSFTTWIYFPLATLAAYKALWELAVKPFYWDKTEHGVSP